MAPSWQMDLGDTIRVSLTEDSVHEIPVAQALAEPYNRTAAQMAHLDPIELSFDPFQYNRRRPRRLTWATSGPGETN